MKKIINGKTYNTETAELIVSGDNGLNSSDCWYQSEELYLTKKGAYFVCDYTNNLTAVSKTGKFDCDPTYTVTSTIHEWLEVWNISELEEREIIAFNILEA